MTQEAINLTWQMQVVLVAGYLGYAVAYSGRRDQIRAFDTTAITLCFGAIALAALEQSLLRMPAAWPWRNLTAAILAVSASILAGSIWHAKLRNLTRAALEKLRADQDDGHTTAWQTITQEPGMCYSQVLVTLKDGRSLESYQMAPFNDLPNGSVVLGLDASIALYVNAITENGRRREVTSISDEDGHRITFIPAEQIVEVDLRRSKK